ncbi:hypothetical protein [Sphingopyxis fribergensis]|nr:hypothetical protein [Sphingopyxis fribergensis]
MSWIIFFPVTLWRTIRRPLATMTYAFEQLQLPEGQQFRATVSPPIMLILAVLIGQVVDIALHGTNPLVKSDKGLASLIDDNTTLLMLRILLFGLFPLILATRYVRRSDFDLDRDTLKAPFYAQCLALAPVALAFTLGTSLLFQPETPQKIFGSVLFGFAVLFLAIVEVRWFSRQLEQSLGRSLLDVGLALIESLVIFFGVGIVIAT